MVPKRPEQAVACSRDKDLRGRAGLHYSWASGNQKEKPTSLVTYNQANKWFFTQLLTGDPTDNIPGLFGVGPVKAKKLLDGITEPLNLYSVVQKEYEARFGSYWRMFMHENARLLWMLRSEDDDVRNWLDELESQRIEELKSTEEEF